MDRGESGAGPEPTGESGEAGTMEEMYRTIFETTGTSTMIFDETLIVRMVNAEMLRTSGYAREQIVGRMKATDFILPEHMAKVHRYRMARIEDPESVPNIYEVQARDANGRVHDGLININRIAGTTLSVVSFVDVTEKYRAERQMHWAEKMAALGRIAAGVGHEINNPNNLITFNLPVLERYVEAMRSAVMEAAVRDPGMRLEGLTAGELFAEVASLIADMKKGSERITDIVRQLRIHVTADGHEKAPGDIGAAIDSAVRMAGKHVSKKVARLEVSLDPVLPQILMNEGRIEQVVINLLLNAADAADKQDSYVRVEARGDAGRGDVTVTVSDNGEGIPPEILGRVFEPFFTTKGTDEGTGLGLWICKGIIEDHGGTIEALSAPGTQTTFTFRLPAAAVKDGGRGGS